MEYSNYYLLVQAFRAVNFKNKDISKFTGLSPSQVSKLLNNKQLTICKKAKKKFDRRIQTYLSYDKTSKRKMHKYEVTYKLKQAIYLKQFLEKKNNKYNVMRISKSWKKLYKENEGKKVNVLEKITSKQSLTKAMQELYNMSDIMRSVIITDLA